MDPNSNSQSPNPLAAPVQSITPNPSLQPPPSIEEITPPGSGQKKMPKFLGFILLILLLLLLGGGTVIMNLSKTSTTKQTALPISPTPTQAPSPTTIQSTWMTYDASEYTFSYPKDWAIAEEAGALLFYVNKQAAQAGFVDGSPGTITLVEKPSGSSTLSINFDDPVGTKKSAFSNMSTEKIKDLTVDGKKAFITKTTVTGTTGLSNEAVSTHDLTVDLGTKHLKMSLKNQGNDKTVSDIFDHIVSSFKFTNQNQTKKISDWKPYKANGYSFVYPSDWNIQESDYLHTVELTNKSKTVTILISDSQYPYDWSSNRKIDEKNLEIKISEKSYNVKEFIVNNNTAYVDFSIDTKPTHHILFGTGYPAGNSTNTSLEDYQNAKSTIFKILSSIQVAPTYTPAPILPPRTNTYEDP